MPKALAIKDLAFAYKLTRELMRVRYGAGYFSPILDDEGYWDDGAETSDSEAGLELVKSPSAKRRRCLLN